MPIFGKWNTRNLPAVPAPAPAPVYITHPPLPAPKPALNLEGNNPITMAIATNMARTEPGEIYRFSVGVTESGVSIASGIEKPWAPPTPQPSHLNEAAVTSLREALHAHIKLNERLYGMVRDMREKDAERRSGERMESDLAAELRKLRTGAEPKGASFNIADMMSTLEFVRAMPAPNRYSDTQRAAVYRNSAGREVVFIIRPDGQPEPVDMP